MTHSSDDTPFWEPDEWAEYGDIRRPRRTPSRGRTRTHHVVERRTPLPPLEPRDVDIWVEPIEHHRPVRRRAGNATTVGVDPRLLRLGVLAVVLVLIAPIALALRDRGGGGGGEVRSASPAGTNDPGGESRDPASSTTVAPRRAKAAENRRTRRPGHNAQNTPSGAGSGAGEVAAVAHVADEAPAEPACAGEYTVVEGDYWVRFAESTEADLETWLAANGASVDTPLYPGDTLCIPAGVSAPEPPPSTTDTPATEPPTTEAPDPTDPPTTEPPTTQAPEPTDPPTTEPPTTQAPDPTNPPTTQPPTTEPPPTTPRPPVSPGSVEAIIRDVWPDAIEDRALVIAQRESGLRPDAYNGWCCYGLFQIYFDANRSFLAGLGVTAPEQLLDARTNVRVAYAMYQRSGWGPWASTDPG